MSQQDRKSNVKQISEAEERLGEGPVPSYQVGRYF